MNTSYLLDCLKDALDAKRTHDAAEELHDGMSWEYGKGEWLVKAMQTAQHHFEGALADYIDERIEEAKAREDTT